MMGLPARLTSPSPPTTVASSPLDDGVDEALVEGTEDDGVATDATDATFALGTEVAAARAVAGLA